MNLGLLVDVTEKNNNPNGESRKPDVPATAK